LVLGVVSIVKEFSPTLAFLGRDTRLAAYRFDVRRKLDFGHLSGAQSLQGNGWQSEVGIEAGGEHDAPARNFDVSFGFFVWQLSPRWKYGHVEVAVCVRVGTNRALSAVPEPFIERGVTMMGHVQLSAVSSRRMTRSRAFARLGSLAFVGALLLSESAVAGVWCDWFGWGCPQTCGALTQIADFGANPGELTMCVYAPPGLPAGRPLVVALHGCAQQAEDYADGPGWTKLADERRFALLLPQQSATNSPTKCFNWFLPNDVKRHDAGGTGEAVSIWAMIRKMQSAPYRTDSNRVYVTGLSAGGAMTAALLAAYPDLFKGGAIVAGIPYGCAENLVEGLGCMSLGKDLPPQAWGDRVRAAAPGHTIGNGMPKVAVWHGKSDGIVKPTNASELVDEWTNALGIDRMPDKTAFIGGAEYNGYLDGTGTLLVEEYLIADMDHGVAIDPAQGCGKAAPFILDKGICSSRSIADFWGL
jgi:poly(hydroxyalkanoate) depolymerase family esterase